MMRRRSSKRLSSRSSRWNMKRKRSRLLKFRQLCAGKIVVILAIFAAFSGIIYVVFFTNTFRVMDVVVTTSYHDINPDQLEAVLQPELVQSNSLFLDVHAVEQQVYDQFPEVSSMDCSRDFFKRSFECEALGYELVAVVNHQDKKYYINENGVVIAFDNRKLGLPIFDLVLNPVFTEEVQGNTPSIADIVEETPEELIPAGPTPLPQSLTASILQGRSSGQTAEESTDGATEETPSLPELDDNQDGGGLISFIQPQDEAPIEPVIINRQDGLFDLVEGKKILAPEEVEQILTAIKQLEEVMGRKVIQVEYIQVAGELSLTSRPQTPEEQPEETENLEEEGEPDPQSGEALDHEFVVLLDLGRDLENQFVKLKKSKEVIDFSQVSRIDLSIDGEKVFYR